MNGKEIGNENWSEGFGPMKMKRHGKPKAGMNGKEITMMSMDISKER